MARPKKYIVSLTDAEREQLSGITKNYRFSKYERNRAQILLFAEQGQTDVAIAAQVTCHAMTVRNVRQRYCQRGENEATPVALREQVKRAKQQNRPARVFDGEKEAKLIAVVCSTPPDGAKQWTLSLLQEKIIALQIVENVAKETIRQTLKKMNSNRSVKTCFDLSKKSAGAFKTIA